MAASGNLSWGMKLLQTLSDKILVFGAGRLAAGIVRHFPNTAVLPHEVCDITDRGAVVAALKRARPHIAINAAAVTNIELCEENPGAAWRVNVFGARNIAAACRLSDVKSVHFSSNWAVDPINEYGMTKRVSEQVDFDLIVRSSFYDESYWLLEALSEGRKTTLLDTDRYNPISIDNLLRVLEKLLIQKSTGVVNVGVVDQLSHFDFGVELARVFGFSVDNIQPVNEVETNYNYPYNTYIEPHRLSRISLADDLREFRENVTYRAVEDSAELQNMRPEPRRDTRSR